MAHFVTPALLSLADDGSIGLKTVDERNRVRFRPVEIIEDTPDGIWLGGLPREIRIITVGQEFVVAGQEVRTIAPDERGGDRPGSGDRPGLETPAATYPAKPNPAERTTTETPRTAMPRSTS